MAEKKEPTARLQKSVLAFLRQQKGLGATDYEIEVNCDLTHQSASARRRELVLRGMAYDSGLRRLGGSGRQNTVWVAPTPKR